MARRTLTTAAAKAALPPEHEFRLPRMHRLIPSRFSESGTVLEDVADNDEILADAARLDAATNERIHGELYGLSGITQFELVYGIPNAHIVRAAFLHPGPFGARFNDTTRGAWYAARAIETSIAEVAYHKARRLSEIVVPESPGGRPDEDVSCYDDWQAGFHAAFHVLEPARKYVDCLQAEPVPQCYAAPQQLARRLLARAIQRRRLPQRSPSRWNMSGMFSAALVGRPRRGARYEIRLRAHGEGYRTTTTRVVVS